MKGMKTRHIGNPSEHKSCVYVMGFGTGNWKIGNTKCLERRKKSSQEMMESDPEIALCIWFEEPRWLEFRLHASFKNVRLGTAPGREWYKVSVNEIAAEAEELIRKYRGETPPDTFAEAVSIVRTRMGMTQNEVAEYAGMRQATVSKVETGGDSSVKTVEAIMKVLGLKIGFVKEADNGC